MSDISLAETHTDIPWLPEGSSIEVCLGDEAPPKELCTSAFVFPFEDSGALILSNVLKRGTDIPGGHIEYDECPLGAAVREVREETGARVEIAGQVGYLKLIVTNPPPGYRYHTPNSYQPFYAGRVVEQEPVEMPEECGSPIRTSVATAVMKPQFRYHRRLMLAAVEVVRPLLNWDGPRSRFG